MRFKRQDCIHCSLPFTDKNLAGNACTAAMQCSTVKESVELGVVQTDALGLIEFSAKEKSVRDTSLMNSKEKYTSRNLLIRLVAYDIMNRSLLLLSQKIKRELQEHAKAKSIKIGTIDVQKNTRMNPDSSYGVFNTAKVCARARAV